MTTNIRKVLSIDTDPVFSYFLHDQLLKGYPGVKLLTAKSLSTALKLVCDLCPEVVIVDHSMGKADGFVVAETIHCQMPNSHVVMFAGRQDDATLLRAKEIKWLAGFIWKADVIIEDVGTIIERICARARYFSIGAQKRLAAMALSPTSFYKLISPAEYRLLSLIGEGLDNDSIAKKLHLSVHTVKTHRKNIYQKLDLHTGQQLMKWCMCHGFFDGLQPESQSL